MPSHDREERLPTLTARHTISGPAWNPVSGITGWDPATGPPGWGPVVPDETRPQQLPPRMPMDPHVRGLSPFGLPARHSWEIPLLVIIVVLTVFAYPYAVYAVGRGTDNVYLSILAFAPILVWFLRGSQWGQARVQGVKMSPTQFPDAYRMVQEAATRFGMKHSPDAYVVLGNGQINAFAAGHGFRRFVVVNSDLFEIGGAARQPEALAFVIGHEVGHIAAGHTSYWRQFGTVLMQFVPVLGPALSRAQEYTADNHGYSYCFTGAAGAMTTLSAGKYLGVLVGFDEMADRAFTETGFFVWLTNLQASHPVNTWRMWALRDRSRHGKLFLRPAPSAT
ncbi:M48 family metalloprotease [Nocardia sp. SYP-A9097]|uniref:M48 family metallopeptidase n=1 Tax=Nocardia sp. SYP-A9097 TaxID=2663237 RepID=UPI00129AED37|nr:M48 family metallopeptidase [Nocardia sp. SYP-A9097]MRH89224.1 M48 family metalloprotease [Nocardia sp. SYP-A9097]